MTPPRPWTALDHGQIETLNEEVWTVDGARPRGPIRRRMPLVRLRDGSLLVHNAIALSEGQMADLERWGEPAHLVVPSGLHRLDAHAWKARYPRSRVWCPTPARARASTRSSGTSGAAARCGTSCPGHGDPVSLDPGGVLRGVAERLAPA